MTNEATSRRTVALTLWGERYGALDLSPTMTTVGTVLSPPVACATLVTSSEFADTVGFALCGRGDSDEINSVGQTSRTSG
jgi:hypothetical protein